MNRTSPITASAAYLLVDLLVTKNGLAEALQSDDAAFETLYAA